MKLYIKQHVFTWGDRFTVKDVNGEDVYTVEGEVFTWGKKLHVYDRSGREVLFISQEVFTFLPRYRILLEGRVAAEVVKEFSFLLPKYRVEGPGWQVEGEFMAHDYTVCSGDTIVVDISKEWMTWGDSYELDIRDPACELLALGVVLAIDACVAGQNH